MATTTVPAARRHEEPNPGKQRPADQPAEEPRPEILPAGTRDFRPILGPDRQNPRMSRNLLSRIMDDPGFAPELLALAAVNLLGPAARDWAVSMRTAYPGATGHGLAQFATRQHLRLAAAGGLAAAASGLFAPLVELAALSWTQAGLVLRLAAAYDWDPTDPDRAVDLLVLTRVHPDNESARSALAAVTPVEQRKQSDEDKDEEPTGPLVGAGWRLAIPLAAQTAGWLALRLAARVLPGAAALTAVAGGSAATERLAARAVARYRGGTSGQHG